MRRTAIWPQTAGAPPGSRSRRLVPRIVPMRSRRGGRVDASVVGEDWLRVRGGFLSRRGVAMEREASFAAEPESVRKARRFVVESLAGFVDDPAAVELLTSELATNAVVHAKTGFRVRVR